MSTQVSAQDLAQRAACAGAAALLSLGALAGPGLASEFDILAEPTPAKNYFVDDAGVLSRSTKSDLNKRLSILEVCSSSVVAVPAAWYPDASQHLFCSDARQHL